MRIQFRTAALRRCYEKQAVAVRAFGRKTARRYLQRIDILISAPSLREVRQLPQLRLHPLKGKRAGQYALDLDQYMRLVVSEVDVETVRIEEVSKHYD